ncbi:hypothetical protein F5883DRAFT_531953 [Diaporthe sp. PMI_573]|nr:hypothetical protein F5883DRAFT_531953 [Diaporthaceae sp. PMI_573]
MPPAEADHGISKDPAIFQCSLCPKRYTRAFNLQGHLRTHTNERPFVCTICGRRFSRKNDEKLHTLTHTKERKFVCKGDLASGQEWGCGRRFSLAKNLGRHFRSEKGRKCIKPLVDESINERQEALVAARALTGMGNASSALEQDHQSPAEQARQEHEPIEFVTRPSASSEGDQSSFDGSPPQATTTAPPTRDEALRAADIIRQYIRHYGQLNYQENGVHGYLELNFKAMTVQTPLLDFVFFAETIASQNQGGEQLLYPNRSLDSVSWY